MESNRETLFADPGAFTLDAAEMAKRVSAIHGAAAGRIIATCKAKYPVLSVPDLHFLAWSDYPTMVFENLIAGRRAAQHQAPTYLYRFDWHSPVQGGQYHTPHTMEIPFVFDNTKLMASMTGAPRRRLRWQPGSAMPGLRSPAPAIRIPPKPAFPSGNHIQRANALPCSSITKAIWSPIPNVRSVNSS